ncbi:MAG TPA: type II secretion system protein [Tepidisphaeraceae bacterium]|jgi:type II secretory pathway pseudopilin PulG|nr:type II secretion system protein [Tepidisphaeraceae bacterium]
MTLARRGMSMMETMAAVAVAGILFASLGSSVVWVSKALPSATDPVVAGAVARDALQQFTTDLRYAMRVTERDARAITFAVPDRNGDGAEETIRYSCEATAGSPLLRAYNGGAPVTIVPRVRSWNIAYRDRAIAVPREPLESAEQSFLSPGLGLLSYAHAVNDHDWHGQYFRPYVPLTATDYRITRVRFRARSRGGNSGQFLVRVMRSAPTGVPTGTVLAETLVLEQSLSTSFEWVNVTFTDPIWLPASEQASIVVTHVSDTDACEVQASSITLSLANTAFLSTGNAAASWSVQPLRSMSLYAWGTYRTPQSPSTAHSLLSLTVTLTPEVGTGSAGGATIAAVDMVNRPEVPAP